MPLFDEKALVATIQGGKTTQLDVSTLIVRDEKAPMKNTATFREHSDFVCALAALPDGRIVSGSGDKTLKLWDVSGKCLATFSGHSDAVRAVAVLPDGRIVSGSDDKTLKLWNESGKCLTTFSGHSSHVDTLAALPDGRIVSGSHDKTIKLWDVSGECLATFDGHSDWVNALAVLPDGRIVSGSSDNTLKLWDVGLRPLALTQLKPLLLALQKNRSIRQVNFQKTLLTDEEIPTLIELLTPNTTVTEIDIRNTAITQKGAAALYQGLAKGRPQLQLLHPAMATILQEQKTTTSSTSAISSSLSSLTSKSSSDNKDSKSEVKQEIKLNPSQQEVKQTSQLEVKKDNSSDTRDSLAVSYTINYQDVKFGKELGRGGFGVVYQGTWRFNDVAVKQLLTSTLSSDAAEEFKAESAIMARLRSPNIVQFYGCCVSPQYCLVMEYMPKGSLFSLLHNKQALDWSVRYRIVTDMACGLAFLHADNILHRDLKSLNVLLDESHRAKLCDFGLAKIKTETRSTTKGGGEAAGTLAWMAPELFERRATYTAKADIYSLGITFWEVASRKIPFADAANPNLIPSWVQKGEREDIPQDCPKKVASLIRFCWQDKPESRPTAAEVVMYLRSNKDEDFEQFTKSTAAAGK